MQQYVGRIRALKPDLVFLQIGGNDLSGPSPADPAFIATSILRLATSFISPGSNTTVVIMKIPPRLPSSRMSPAQSESFRLRINTANVCLMNDVVQVNNSLTSGCIQIATHSGVWQAEAQNTHYDLDGVHFNNKGNTKYFRTLRNIMFKTIEALDTQK